MIYITGGDIKELTEEYIQALKDGNPTHIDITQGEYPNIIHLTDDDIAMDGGVTISTIMNPDSDYVAGKTISTELKMHIIKSDKTDNLDWNAVFGVRLGVEINGTTQYVRIGYFWGSTPQRITTNGTEVLVYTGYDAMASFDNVSTDNFISTLVFPMTMADLLSEISTYFNISFTNFDGYYTFWTINTNPFKQGSNLRQILTIVMEAINGYARITKGSNNSIYNETYYHLPNYNIQCTITKDDYFVLNKEEFLVPSITGVCLIDTADESKTFSHPSSYTGIPYYIVNNPIVNQLSDISKLVLANTIIEKHQYDDSYPNHPRYIPMNVTSIGIWLIETGDIINVEDADGTILPMRVFTHIIKWNGSCTSYLECTGNIERKGLTTEQQQQYETSGMINDALVPIKETLNLKWGGEVEWSPSGVDLDDIFSGQYAFLSTALPSNRPSSVPSLNAYVLAVHASSESSNNEQTMQYYITFQGGIPIIFARRYFTTWGDWYSVGNNGNYWLPNNTNIDNVLAPGTYGVSSQSSYSGTLPTNVNTGILEVFAPSTTAAYIIQRLTNPPNMYFRCRNQSSGEAWGNWYKITGTLAQ